MENLDLSNTPLEESEPVPITEADEEEVEITNEESN